MQRLPFAGLAMMLGLAVAGCRGTDIEANPDAVDDTELIGEQPEDPATFELGTEGGVDTDPPQEAEPRELGEDTVVAPAP